MWSQAVGVIWQSEVMLAADFRKCAKIPTAFWRVWSGWVPTYSRQSVGAALMYLSEHPRTLGPGRTWVLLSERAACECEQVAQGRKHDESTAVCHRDARGLTNLRGAIGVYFQRDQLAAEIQEHASSS
jgi:hypothetical protein